MRLRSAQSTFRGEASPAWTGSGFRDRNHLERPYLTETEAPVLGDLALYNIHLNRIWSGTSWTALVYSNQLF